LLFNSLSPCYCLLKSVLELVLCWRVCGSVSMLSLNGWRSVSFLNVVGSSLYVAGYGQCNACIS
jgi:hypothetical protein